MTNESVREASGRLSQLAWPVLVLLLAYPLLVHLAVVWHEPRLEWLALIVLCAAPQYRSLRAGRIGNWSLLLGLAGILYGLTSWGGGIYAFFLPPVAVPAILFSVFASSLRDGQTPLVTRVAQSVHGPLKPEISAYTRQVTWLWALVLTLFTLSNAGLALFAPLALWSWVTNFLNYALIGLIFVVEYLYRRWRFRDIDHPGFLNYLRLVACLDYKSF